MIGREREVGRVCQILARRTKNNPILLGEPGVGKTAIAEGLAYAIVHKVRGARGCHRRRLATGRGGGGQRRPLPARLPRPLAAACVVPPLIPHYGHPRLPRSLFRSTFSWPRSSP